jgi:quinol monooxygenase YgiN
VILVTGSITARSETLDEILRLSLDHVRRSRTEPGCLSHAVHRDCEDSLRLVFVERWASREALRTHFQVPASREFVKAVRALAAAAEPIAIYEAEQLDEP